jgi:hypothetical protein
LDWVEDVFRISLGDATEVEAAMTDFCWNTLRQMRQTARVFLTELRFALRDPVLSQM